MIELNRLRQKLEIPEMDPFTLMDRPELRP